MEGTGLLDIKFSIKKEQGKILELEALREPFLTHRPMRSKKGPPFP